MSCPVSCLVMKNVSLYADSAPLPIQTGQKLPLVTFQTGDRETRNAIFETVLTKPEPVTSLTMEDIQTGRGNPYPSTHPDIPPLESKPGNVSVLVLLCKYFQNGPHCDGWLRRATPGSGLSIFL